MSAPERWWEITDWWTDPRLAYARGLHDGYTAGRADRDAEDDQVHREAVQRVGRLIARADRRAAADQRGERPGDHRGQAA